MEQESWSSDMLGKAASTQLLICMIFYIPRILRQGPVSGYLSQSRQIVVSIAQKRLRFPENTVPGQTNVKVCKSLPTPSEHLKAREYGSKVKRAPKTEYQPPPPFIFQVNTNKRHPTDTNFHLNRNLASHSPIPLLRYDPRTPSTCQTCCQETPSTGSRTPPSLQPNWWRNRPKIPPRPVLQSHLPHPLFQSHLPQPLLQSHLPQP